MPALERLAGIRVVADPDALDAAHWHGDDVIVLRFSPDEALGIGGHVDVETHDPHAIIEAETGFVGTWLDPAEVAPHTEWPLPTVRPVLAQGSIAGVPAKLWLPDEGKALLLTAAAHSQELADRLGLRR